MKFGMQTYVKVCCLYGMGGVQSYKEQCVWMCVCVCVWLGEAGGITLMKNKFQKASITSAQARAPAFAFQCEVQPPLFMMLYTSKPRPASLYLAHSHSLSLSPLIPIVTTSPGSICLYGGKRQRPVGWFGTSRLLMGVNKQEVQLRRSLNYQIVILNKHLRWLMGRVLLPQTTATDDDRCFLNFHFCFLYLRVCSVIVAAVISASTLRQMFPLWCTAFCLPVGLSAWKEAVLSWHTTCYAATNWISTLN